MDDFDRYITDTEPSRRRRISFAWPVLLISAWILYELTHQPMLAVIALCTKFGWEDFRTARWLRRRDPRTGRGRANFYLYVAGGLWKMAAVATLIIVANVALLVVLQRARGQQLGMDVVQAIGQQMGGAMLVTMVGIFFSTLAVWAAIGLACRCRCKLWLNSSVHAARRRDDWPPPPTARRGFNLLPVLVWTSLLAVGGPFFLSCLGLAIMALARAGPFLVISLALLMGAPFAVGKLVKGVFSKVMASGPAECWGLPSHQGAEDSGDLPWLEPVADQP